MSLRSELVAMLEEFEHFAYDGAPIYTATEKVREILEKTTPKVLTTVEELDSLEPSKSLCLIPNDGSGPVGFYDRTQDGQNEWAGFGSDHFQTSAELFADFDAGHVPAFTLIQDLDAEAASPVVSAPQVLTTEAELNSVEAFDVLCIVPPEGLPRTPSSRSDGVNYWQKPGDTREYSSADLLASCIEAGAKPVFTRVDCSFPPVDGRVLSTEDELNSAEAFYALCIVPYGGPLRVAIRRRDGITYWREPGYAGEYSSAELLAHFASIGAEPAFTLITGS